MLCPGTHPAAGAVLSGAAANLHWGRAGRKAGHFLPFFPVCHFPPNNACFAFQVVVENFKQKILLFRIVTIYGNEETVQVVDSI